MTITNTLPPDPGHLRPRDGWATAQATIRDLERDTFARMMEIPRSGERVPASNPAPVAREADSSPAPSQVSSDGSIEMVGARPIADLNLMQHAEAGTPPPKWAHAIESETLRTLAALGLPLPTPVRPSTVATDANAGTPASERVPARAPDPTGLHVAIMDGRAEIAVRANAPVAVLGFRLLAVLDELGIHPGVIKVNGIVNGRPDKGVSDGN